MAVQSWWLRHTTGTEPGVIVGPFASLGNSRRPVRGYLYMSDNRNLTDHERSVLEFRLARDWDGADVLREQLATARFTGKHGDSAAFDIAVDAEAPRVPAKTPIARVGDLFLRVENGVLVGLGCSASVKELPSVDKLQAA